MFEANSGRYSFIGEQCAISERAHFMIDRVLFDWEDGRHDAPCSTRVACGSVLLRPRGIQGLAAQEILRSAIQHRLAFDHTARQRYQLPSLPAYMALKPVAPRP